MEAWNMRHNTISGMKPADVLREFIGVFSNRGLLNQAIRVKHHEKSYRLLCNEKAFIAYRINDNQGFSPGVPGWAVCIVDREQIVEDSEITASAEAEPGVCDWLRCVADGDYETI